MIVMTWFLLENYKKQKGFNGNEFIASTIASTPMMKNLAQADNVEYKEVLTGFKWIAKLIKDFQDQNFIIFEQFSNNNSNNGWYEKITASCYKNPVGIA